MVRLKSDSRDMRIVIVEVVILVIFLSYFIVRMIVDLSWKKFFALSSLTDVLIIVPFFLGLLFSFEEEGYWAFFRPLCLMKFYFQGVRILGNRYIRKIISSFNYFMIKLYFSIFSIILVAAMYVYLILSTFDDPDITLETSLYFVMVTLSTVGYGDIAPQTFAGRALVIGLILTALIVFPLQIGELVERINSQPSEDTYQRKGSIPHVILSGDICYSSVKDFLEEFFDSDRGSIIPMVILSFSELTDQHKILLQDPLYHKFVSYIHVSMIDIESTLQNIQIEKAQSVFILADRSGDYQNADSVSIMQVLLFRKYNKDLSIFVQLYDPINKSYAYSSGANTVICINELKLGILAKNISCPGFSTMLTTLTRSFGKFEVNNFEEDWKNEYGIGLNYEIYQHSVPTYWSGLCFIDCARYLFHQNKMLFFAIKKDDQILMNPGDTYILDGDEIGFFFCTSKKQLLSGFNTNILENELIHFKTSFDLDLYIDHFDTDDESLLIEINNETPEGFKDHFILSGITSQVLYLIKIIRKKFSLTTPLIILTKSPDKYNKIMTKYKDIHVVHGTPTNWTDLKIAGIKRASVVLILSQESSKVGILSDSTVVFISAMLNNLQLKKKIKNDLKILYEVNERSNIGLISPLCSNVQNPHFTESFSSGRAYSSSMLETLLCQTFFTPDLLEILKQMIWDREDNYDNSSSTAKLISLPENLRGSTYGDLFDSLSSANIIPLGLRRHRTNNLPYVLVCPSATLSLHKHDKIYILTATAFSTN